MTNKELICKLKILNIRQLESTNLSYRFLININTVIYISLFNNVYYLKKPGVRHQNKNEHKTNITDKTLSKILKLNEKS